jgi:hypothetical protein
MIAKSMKNIVTIFLAIGLLKVPNTEANGYVGPLDMADWSRGPSCSESDENNPMRYKRIQCDEAAVRIFDSNSIVPNAFHNSHFDQLERLYSTWLAENARYAGGTRKDALLCDALGRTIGGAGIQSSLGQIEKWQAETNHSFLSRYAEAAYWRAAAWSARGNGYANAVTKEGWLLFGERLKKSLDVLDKMGNESKSNPAWYPLKIDVMLDMGAPLGEIRKVFLDGVSRFPEYHSTYFSMGRAYSPLWGGSRKSFDAFVQEVVKKTTSFEGNAFYARLYWTVDQDNNIPFRDESSEFPKWEKLKVAYTELMKKYPESQWNKNRFAEVSCRSSDSKLYRQLRTEIDGRFIDDMFGPGARDTCDLKHNWKLSK